MNLNPRKSQLAAAVTAIALLLSIVPVARAVISGAVANNFSNASDLTLTFAQTVAGVNAASVGSTLYNQGIFLTSTTLAAGSALTQQGIVNTNTTTLGTLGVLNLAGTAVVTPGSGQQGTVSTTLAALNANNASIAAALLANAFADVSAQTALIPGLTAAYQAAQDAVTATQQVISDAQQRVNLYTSVTGPTGALTVATANAATTVAAVANIATQFAAGTNGPTGAGGSASNLQTLINTLNTLPAGTGATQTANLTTAYNTFVGYGANPTIPQIQTFLAALNAELVALPPISQTNIDTVATFMLNGGWERNATGSISAIIHQTGGANGPVHIGENSLVTDQVGDTAGVGGTQSVYATDVNGAAIAVNLTGAGAAAPQVNGVAIASTGDVAAEATTRGNADTAINTNVTNEVNNRTAVIRATAAEASGNTQSSRAEIHIGANSLVTYETTGVPATSKQVLTNGTTTIALEIRGNVEFTKRPTLSFIDPAAATNLATATSNKTTADTAVTNTTTAYNNALAAEAAALNSKNLATAASLAQATADYAAAQAASAAALTAKNNAVTTQAAAVTALATATAYNAAQAFLDVSNATDLAASAVTVTAGVAGNGLAGTAVALNRDVVAEAQARWNADTAETTRATAAEAALGTRVSANEALLVRHSEALRTLRRGVAMAAALQTPVLQPGKDNAASFGASSFDGQGGFAVGYARRVNDSASVNLAVATSGSETIVRGGVNVAW